jgi:RNA polymerase sigma factor (sigma-70 family)
LAAVPSRGRASRVESHAEAASDLYERYSAQVFGYCFHQLGSREEAEDAVQTTFLNAFRGLARGIVPKVEHAWVFKIAHNVCLSRRRSSSRRGRVEAPNNLEVLQEVVPAKEKVADELISLQQVLEGMPDHQRRAILLREWQGLSYREIADELELSQGAVETLIFRARRALAAGLEEAPATGVWGKRARRGADVGGALAFFKAMLGGGGAAAVKVATVVALAGATVATTAADRMLPQHHPRAKAPVDVAPRQAPDTADLSPAVSGGRTVEVPRAHHPAPQSARAPRPSTRPPEPISRPAPVTNQAATPPPASQEDPPAAADTQPAPSAWNDQGHDGGPPAPKESETKPPKAPHGSKAKPSESPPAPGQPEDTGKTKEKDPDPDRQPGTEAPKGQPGPPGGPGRDGPGAGN